MKLSCISDMVVCTNNMTQQQEMFLKKAVKVCENRIHCEYRNIGTEKKNEMYGNNNLFIISKILR